MSEYNKITGDFDAKWTIVTKELERMKEKGIFPLKSLKTDVEKDYRTTVADLNAIKNKPFTISVCGVVKAGKSTFLNAFLFEDDNILPTLATPMTAKLTFINYTDKKNNFFKVEFYNKEEFKSLKDCSDEFSKELKERIKFVGEKYKIYEPNYIGKKDDTEHPLNDLAQYVAKPEYEENIEKGIGKYTPFVKSVNVYINNDILKNVRIVDTPGLNDSNRINSIETQKFINQSHALIYLFPSRGIDAHDESFLKEHDTGNSNLRVFIINRIDDYNSKEDLQQAKEECYKTIKRDEKICGYSAAGVLFGNMKAKGRTLTKEEEYTYKLTRKAEAKGISFNPDNIEEKIRGIISCNEGKVRIESAADRLNDIYNISIDNCELKRLEIKNYIEDLDKSNEDLKKEIEKKQKERDAWETKNENVEGKILKRIEEICAEYHSQIRNLLSDIAAELKAQKKDKVKENVTSLQMKFNKIKAENDKIIISFKDEIEKLSKEQKKIIDRQDIGNQEIADFFLNGIELSDFSGIKAKLEKIQEDLPAHFFTWWGYDISKDYNTKIDEVCSELGDVYEKVLFGDSARAGYVKQFKSYRDKIGENIQKEFDNKVKNSKKNAEEKDKEKKAKKEELRNIVKRLDELKFMQRDFKEHIDA